MSWKELREQRSRGAQLEAAQPAQIGGEAVDWRACDAMRGPEIMICCTIDGLSGVKIRIESMAMWSARERLGDRLPCGHLGRDEPRERLWKHGGILGDNMGWRDERCTRWRPCFLGTENQWKFRYCLWQIRVEASLYKYRHTREYTSQEYIPTVHTPGFGLRIQTATPEPITTSPLS